MKIAIVELNKDNKIVEGAKLVAVEIDEERLKDELILKAAIKAIKSDGGLKI